MSDLQVQAELKLKDSLSRPAGTALDSLGKSAAKTGTAVDAIGKGEAMKGMAKDAKSAAKSMDAIGKEAKDAARNMDAIASESREVGGNMQKAEQRASALRRTLRGVGQTARDAVSHMQRLGRGMDGVWKTGAGLAASGYAAKKAIDAPVSRERQYLDDANIAEVDVNKLRELDASAVKYGGGTLEGARATRGALFQAGLDFAATDKVLPGIQRTATATASEGADLANMVAAGLKAKQFKAEDVEIVLGMAANAGSVGAFETKDMAKHMPGIFTNAPDMLGVRGAAYHFSNLQVLRDAAGSSDEAAMLYANLQAFRSGDVAEKRLKKKVNLTAIYQRTAASGGDMNMALVDAIQKGVVEKDKLYKKLHAQWEKADGKGKEALKMQLSSRQIQLFSKVIPDRQARQAAVALANGGERRAEVLAAVEGNPLESVDKFFERVQTSTQSKFDSLGNAWETAMDGFFAKAKPILDAGLKAATDFMSEHPDGSVALAGATAVGGSIAAGSGVVAAWDFLRKGKGGGSGTTSQGISTAAETAADATSILGKRAKALKGAGRAAKIGGPIGAALAAVDAITTEMDDALTREQKNIAHSGAAGGFIGGMGGAAAGAAAGSVIPVVGTILGAVIGGLLGALGGEEVGEKIGQALWGENSSAQSHDDPMPDDYLEALQYVQQQAAQQPISVTIENKLDIDGDRIAEAVTRRLVRDDTRR